MPSKYPITDFNGYNLDWIIERIRDLTKEWAETKTEWSDMKTELTDLKNYIMNYFDNLDVQAEIDHKIDEMAADGSLLEIIRPDIQAEAASVTSAWIADNLLQETGYVIDSSLTVANAAADAKAVGDAIIYRTVPTTDAVANYCIFSTDGKVQSNSAFSYISFNVLEGDTIQYKTHRSETDLGIAFYNAFGAFVSGTTTDGTELSISVPSGAVSAKACYRTTQASDFSVKQCYNINTVIDHISDLEDVSKYMDPVRKTIKLDYDNEMVREYSLSLFSSNTRTITQFIPLYDAINTIEVKDIPAGYDAAVFFFDDPNGYHVASSSWYNSDFKYDNPHLYIGYKIYFRYPDNSTMDATDIAAIAASAGINEYYAIPEMTGYVDSAGNNSNNGMTRSTAVADIPTAISKGFRNILVKEGTYDPFTLSKLSGCTISIDTYYSTYTAGSDEDWPKVVIDGDNSETTGITMTDCKDVKIIGFEVKDCVTNGVSMDDSTDIEMIDCIIHDIAVGQTSGQGYKIKDTNAVFKNCGAYNIGGTSAGTGTYHIDGFNIHNTGNVDLYNCWAYNCEDDGVSHHDACTGVVDGGEWYNCGKGGVASPTHGATVNVKNVLSHSNAYGLYISTTGSGVVTTRPNIQITNCVFVNNDTYDITTDDFYTVLIWKCLYGNSDFGTNTHDLLS